MQFYFTFSFLKIKYYIIKRKNFEFGGASFAWNQWTFSLQVVP